MSKQIKLYSFDIFDTLITRRVAAPAGIFALMQEKLNQNLPEDFRSNFYQIRIDSERYARDIKQKENGAREINFDEIYDLMQKQHGLSNEAVNEIKNLELHMEIEDFIPVTDNINRIKELISNGEKVVLISDMYYSAETIRRFLLHVDNVFENITVYVSSEHKAGKYDGKLYLKIREAENIKFGEWKHFGDNKFSDIKKAKRLGIKAVHTPLPELMPYEKEALELNPSSALYQCIIGSARLCRMNKQEKNQDKYDFGASFAAPVLYNYVNWVLDDSLKKGFKTLHFIARDGYIPKIMADMIIQKRGLDIKTKYIYGSRLAWRIPCEENFEYVVNMMINEYPNRFTLRLLAERLQLDLDKLNQYFKLKNVDKLLNSEERVALADIMLKNTDLRKYILDENLPKVKLLSEYIKQEIDLTENNAAFVDIIGSGNTLDVLCGYINSIRNNTNVHTYYLTSSAPQRKNSKSVMYTYCIKPKANYHYFELITRANSGQTLGYMESNGKIEPIQEEGYKEKILTWGIEDYIRGCVDFTQYMLQCYDYDNDIDFCYLYHDYITEKCTKDTAVILGDMPFTNVGKENNIQQTAAKLSILDLIKIYILKEKREKYTEFSHLSYVRSNFISEIFISFINQFDFISDFFAEMRLLNYIKKTKNNTIMFWGASLFLEDFLKKYHIKNKHILGIIDKNPVRQEQVLCGYKIYSPDILNNIKPDYLLTTVKNRNQVIFYQVSNYINKEYQNITVLPNIFGK